MPPGERTARQPPCYYDAWAHSWIGADILDREQDQPYLSTANNVSWMNQQKSSEELGIQNVKKRLRIPRIAGAVSKSLMATLTSAE